MPIDFNDKPSRGFDPNNISRKRSLVNPGERSTEIGSPTPAKTPRSPIGSKIIKTVKNSHMWQRHGIRQETKTADTLVENARSKKKLARAERKLTSEEIELYEEQIDKAALEDDVDYAIEHRRNVREAKRANKLDKVVMKGEMMRHSHDKIIRPNKKTGMSKEERLREEFEQFSKTGVSGMATKIARELKAKISEEYGGWDNVPEDKQRYVNDMLAEALRRDQSKG